MRTWIRANRDQLCGNCRHQIAVGDPVLVIRIPGIRDRVRCDHCEGPAPPDLSPWTPESRSGSLRAEAFTRIGRLVGSLPPSATRNFLAASDVSGRVVADFKLAQAGEREPGEDDA